jgi:glycosyl hydrolase family 113
MLDELVEDGATWVSITPFGRVWSLDSTEILLDFEAPAAQNREDVGRAIDQAHERGLRVLLVPHLWVETTGWRGDINPGTPEAWTDYIDSYERFLASWTAVAAAHHADMLSLGVECKSWSGRFGDRWTRMIAAVRRHYHGLLTYSANWDEAIDVLFWDQIDVVGINAFYPLADSPEGDYDAGARHVVEQVREVAATFDLPVLFVEFGYTTRPAAAVQPWEWPDDMVGVAVDEGEQARAYRAVLSAYTGPDWLAGLFVWRYYADPDDVTQEAAWGFSPRAKKAEQVLAEAFTWQWGADGDPGL